MTGPTPDRASTGCSAERPHSPIWCPSQMTKSCPAPRIVSAASASCQTLMEELLTSRQRFQTLAADLDIRCALGPTREDGTPRRAWCAPKGQPSMCSRTRDPRRPKVASHDGLVDALDLDALLSHARLRRALAFFTVRLRGRAGERPRAGTRSGTPRALRAVRCSRAWRTRENPGRAPPRARALRRGLRRSRPPARTSA